MIYKTFKSARHAARQMAKVKRKHWTFIEIVISNNGKKFVGYNVVSENPTTEDYFYVHNDGRVCRRSELDKENRKWNRHPEQMKRASPFVYHPRNRYPGEGKKEYVKKMSIVCRCYM